MIAADRETAGSGLCYVSDDGPGITRRRRGKGFSYYRPDGTLITDPEERERIDSLAIPPAYRQVWISPDPNGHLQATGRDERGRKQYVYHPDWLKLREQDKFDHLLDFALALPRIRERVRRDLRRDGLVRERVLAAVIRLLESTLARVGNDSYARENGSYGLTTIRKKHVELEDEGAVTFEFEGKGGQEWHVSCEDPKVVEVVRQCSEIAGYELFKYFDETGTKRDVTSGDVNDYLRAVSGKEITAKDFRTWHGTVLCAGELMNMPAADERQAKKNIVAAVRNVARVLGNTPAVCRQSYVHPAVLDSYLAGELSDRLDRHRDNERLRSLRGIERKVAGMLAEESRG